MKINHGVVNLTSTALFPFFTNLEKNLRNKVVDGTMDYNFVVGSLNDFSFPYLFTLGGLSILKLANEKIGEKYSLLISSFLPTIFTIHEYCPFLPSRGGKLADTFDINDITAYWLGGLGAYLTSKGISYINKRHELNLINNKKIDNLKDKLKEF